jgi:hypothetical protein
MPAVVAVPAAVLRAQPLLIHAQGGGELPLAQGRHVTQPDAGPIGAGAAEGGGLGGLGNAGLQLSFSTGRSCRVRASSMP